MTPAKYLTIPLLSIITACTSPSGASKTSERTAPTTATYFARNTTEAVGLTKFILGVNKGEKKVTLWGNYNSITSTQVRTA